MGESLGIESLRGYGRGSWPKGADGLRPEVSFTRPLRERWQRQAGGAAGRGGREGMHGTALPPEIESARRTSKSMISSGGGDTWLEA